MRSALKRELLFWLIFAVAAAGYVGLGYHLAPTVPPEPQMKKDRVNTLEELHRWLQQTRQRREAVTARNTFLRQWYRWGAGIGIVVLLLGMWWRPFLQREGPPADSAGPHRPRRDTLLDQLPVSRSALIWMLGSLVVVIAAIVVLAKLGE